jgi:hypothetical protein
MLCRWPGASVTTVGETQVDKPLDVCQRKKVKDTGLVSGLRSSPFAVVIKRAFSSNVLHSFAFRIPLVRKHSLPGFVGFP